MEMLVDLAQEMRGYDYFRSEDPIEAARFVVSDAVALLWSRVREQLGVAEFACYAAPQLLRWESKYVWTRTGSGGTSEKESSLATVAGRMLSAPDMWASFADRYLVALDSVAGGSGPTSRRHGNSASRCSEDRARDLAEWHLSLLDRLFGSEAEDRLDRLAEHPALGGPELSHFRAELAHRRGISGPRAV